MQSVTIIVIGIIPITVQARKLQPFPNDVHGVDKPTTIAERDS